MKIIWRYLLREIVPRISSLGKGEGDGWKWSADFDFAEI
jgi:hypothetical protein